MSKTNAKHVATEKQVATRPSPPKSLLNSNKSAKKKQVWNQQLEYETSNFLYSNLFFFNFYFLLFYSNLFFFPETARSGLLRQDLTGRCVSPVSCAEGAALQAEDGRQRQERDEKTTYISFRNFSFFICVYIPKFFIFIFF